MSPPAPTSAPTPGTARRALAAGGHVHLIGIGGVGMAALAGLLRHRGYEVSGSDQGVYPPMSTVLEHLDIPVREGFRPENLADRPHLVVVGNAVSRANPEVAAMLAAGLPHVSLPQALAELFLEGKRPVVVAGTHGKTTSAALLAWVLQQAGHDPSLMVGGHALNFGGNFKLGAGPIFVVEGDEYDSAFFDKRPKFIHYGAAAVLLTAVEFDHADIYRDLEHVQAAFRSLLARLPAGTPLVVSSDSPAAAEILDATAARVETFGLGREANWRATGLADSGAELRFRVVRNARTESLVSLQLAGAINARNALGAYAMARALGVEASAIPTGLRTFRGVARRQEFVGDHGGVTLIDDFAHHPTAVAGVIAAMRERYRGRTLWALFEPRSNTSRRKVFQRQYAAALAGASRVVVADVFAKSTDPLPAGERLSPPQLVADLRARGTAASFAPNAEEIAALVCREAASGDVVLLMSNGSFGGLRQRLVSGLSSRA